MKFLLLFFGLLFSTNIILSQSLTLPINRSWVSLGDLDVPGNKLTVEALIYLDQPAVLANNIVSKHYDPLTVNYLLRPLTFELTTYINGNSGPTKFLLMNNPYTLSINKWYHVAGTYDGQFVKYYVDGCLVIDTAWTGNLMQNDLIAAIGNISNVNVNEQFLGKIDEVRIWNVCRGESEISSNMLSLPNPTTQTGLLAYYKFSNNYINSQGNPTWNGIPIGPLTFSSSQATIQPLSITAIQISNSTCSKSKNGAISITGNRANSLYSINGANYQTASTFSNLSPGTYIVHVKSPEGCTLDSTVTVGDDNFFFSINLSSTICQGASVLGHTVSGTFQDTLVAINGCDTLRTLNLNVKPKSISTVNQSICQGQSYLGHAATGTYIDTFVAANGCDSIRNLNLTVQPKPTLTINQSICQGQSYLGHAIAGTYIDTFVAANGCDSIRTLNLTVKPKKTSIINQSICQGQSYFGHAATGTYIDTFVAANGCDSIRTLNLTVQPKPTLTINHSICQGQSYLGHAIAGTYIDTFVAANGCDSIRTLNLTVKPKKTSIINQSICQGQSYFGHAIAGTYIDTLIALGGCDSIRTLILTVQNLPKPDLGAYAKLCIGDSLILSPGNFTTYLWQDNSTLDHYVVKNSGIYSVTVTNTCGGQSNQISVTERLCNEIFPTAFSPNGDGLNDNFKILDAFNLKEYNLSIYNRYGQKVFETTDFNKGWNGTINGIPQDTGTFVYFCRYTKESKQIQTKGTVILLR